MQKQVLKVVVLGSVIGAAVACAPSATKTSGEKPIALAPTELSAPAQDSAQDGVELAAEEHLGSAGRSERVTFQLTRDLRLLPSMDTVGLTEEYTAYVQDGISKHGKRNYSDAFVPVLLRDRAFCVVRFRPFQSEEERAEARAKITTRDLTKRLKNTDLARTLKRGEKLVFTVDRSSQSYDKQSGLTSIMLYPTVQDAQSPQYIARVKCVGAETDVQMLRSSFGVRVVRGLE